MKAIIFFFSIISFSVQASSEFEPEPWMKLDVDFWVSVYSKYNTSQAIIHDAKYIDHIFEVVPSNLSALAKKKWVSVLLSVQKKQAHPELLTADEKKAFEIYSYLSVDQKRFEKAAKRLRIQTGQSDRFRKAISRAKRFLPKMEEIFEKKGLPKLLTRIPYVESMFDPIALSKVGASGIWQIMPRTGMRFLKITPYIDERNDILDATEAAAQLLKENHQILKSWPLAVIAYNHGVSGVLHAKRTQNAIDLKDMVDRYRSRIFQFASRNFYLEFLAVLEVEKNQENLFGKLDPANEIPWKVIEVKSPIRLTELIKSEGGLRSDWVEQNQGLSHEVYTGKRKIPKGAQIKVPALQ